MMKSRTALATITVMAASALLLSGCSPSSSKAGNTSNAKTKGQTITVWSEQNQPDRVKKTQSIINAFTKESGIKVNLVGVDGDQFPTLIQSAALSGKLPDVVGALALGDVRSLEGEKLLNTDVPGKVIQDLGEKTFDASAMKLTTDGNKHLSVPDSAFTMLLMYRKDLFEKAGLKPPTTYAALETAAKKLTANGKYGITLATDPSDIFSQQSFAGLAAGNNCQLVNKSGKIELDSTNCAKTWDLYGNLAQKYSPQGTQTVDSTRATYFAGQAAMLYWSNYILAELGGLQNNILPACPQCQGDPTWLAKNTGIVTKITGPDAGSNAGTWGEITSWVATKTAKAAASEKFMEYMMSTGYVDWLSLAAQGMVPVRNGDSSDSQKFSDAWKSLKIGVDTMKPLNKAFDSATLAGIQSAPAGITRWALPEGQGALLGPLSTQLTIPKIIGGLGSGSINASQAAQEAQSQVTQLQAKSK